MRLATFLDPAPATPARRRGPRRPASSPSRPAPSLDRLADRRPLARRRRRRTALADVDAARARCRGRGRSSASASTTRRTPRETGHGAARVADRLHEAAELERAARRPGPLPGGRASGSTTRASSRSSWAPAGAIAGYAVADDVSRARPAEAASRSGRAPRASTRRCPWGPWITTADEVPDPRGAAPDHATSTASCARTRRPPTSSSARSALVDFLVGDDARSSPATSSSPARRAASASRWTRRASWPRRRRALEIESLGVIEHRSSAATRRRRDTALAGANASQSLLKYA